MVEKSVVQTSARAARSTIAVGSDPVQAGPVLAEQVTVGGTPGSQTSGTPAAPGTRYVIKAIPQREYVSGQTTVYSYNWLRALQWPIDDITADFGSDLYYRMTFDDAVKAAITTLKSSILAEPLEILTAGKDRARQSSGTAQDIADCCRRMVDNLELTTPLMDVLWNMLDALFLGNKISELIYDFGEAEDSGRLLVKAIKVKRREVVSFVVDMYYNIVGFLALIPGQGLPVQQGIILTEPDRIPNLLPAYKFMWLSWRPEDGDPRGTSLLRSAYTPWNMKMQMLPEYLKFLTQFAGPSIAGFLPEGAVTTYLVDSNGNPLLGTDGLPIGEDPGIEMQAQLQMLRNSFAGSFPFGAKLQIIESAGSNNGQAFERAIGHFDDSIAKAILAQTLATGEGRHDSRAAAQVHQDVLDMLVLQGKLVLASMLKRMLFRPTVLYNWGPKYLPLTPSASFGQVAQPDRAALWASMAALMRERGVLPSQLAELYAEVGLPTPSAEDLDEVRKRWMNENIGIEASVQAAAQLTPGGTGNGTGANLPASGNDSRGARAGGTGSVGTPAQPPRPSPSGGNTR